MYRTEHSVCNLLCDIQTNKDDDDDDLRYRRHDRILASNHDQRNFIDRQLHKQLLTTSTSQ